MYTPIASHKLPENPSLTRFAPCCTKGVQYAVLAGFIFLGALSTAAAADFSGSLKGVSITDAQATNRPPAAAFTYSISGNTVSFDASGSSDPDGTISQYKWDFGDGTTGSGAQLQHVYSAQTAMPVTLTIIDNQNGVTLSQKEITFAEPVNKSINFQPSTAPVPTGFLMDSGAALNATNGYGWTSPPLSLGTRDRDSSLSLNQAYDTFIHIDPTGIWEMVLPNGTYSVTVCIGDATYPDGSDTVLAEDVPIIVNQSLSTTTRWIEKTAQIVIADGRLTLKFIGSIPNAKLCWVKVVSI